MCVVFLGLTSASCRSHSPATPGLSTTRSDADVSRPAQLAGVGLSPITGGYKICSTRPLHACRAVAVTGLGALALPLTDIAASDSCTDQEARATQHCAAVGKPYDALNLRCLAGQGIWNSLLSDPVEPAARNGNPRLTLRCSEGETWIDLMTPI